MLERSYWNHNGLYEHAAKALNELVPVEGEVANKRKNPQLERFRKASNAYYDLYNNGLWNRARSFAKLFGIAPSWYRVVGRRGDFSPFLYADTEAKMDEIVLAAAQEQGIPLYKLV